MKYLYTLLLLLSTTVVFAQPPTVKVVPVDTVNTKWQEVRVEKGKLIVLSAEPKSKWIVAEENPLDLVVAEEGKQAFFTSKAEGRFKLVVVAPNGEAAKVILFVVGGEPPVPPDELKKRLSDALAADTGIDKVEQAKDLAVLYEKLAELTKDKSYTKASELLTKAREVANTLIGVDSLVGIRTVVKEELTKIYPIDGLISDKQRVDTVILFDKLAKVLTELTEAD
jgi:hypothetical protein